MAPKVSVLIPTYNRAALLPDAVASVLGQTMRDLELIVIDDGSTDGTANMLAELFGADPRLRVIRTQNSGAARARNRGVDEARADYIALLDSDDIHEPEFLATQIELLENNPTASLAICDARYEGPWEHDHETLTADRGYQPPVSVAAMVAGAWSPTSVWLMRTRVLREFRFDAAVQRSEDTEMLWRLNNAGHEIIWNPEKLAIYRRHRDPGSPQKSENQIDRDRVHIELIERYGADEPGFRRSLAYLHRVRAIHLCRAGRSREARPHAWVWWSSRPSSLRALGCLVRSVVAR
ncbi:MAG: glycosyltransferase family 2 protein [Planctomycetota bacterium]